MSEPLMFSIIMPAFNRKALIQRAIASCLKQRHSSFEVVVIDDGSTDGTAESVTAIGDPRVRLVVQAVNRGVSPARNLGIENARGEWVVSLDSDDEFTDDALELMDAAIKSAPADVEGFRFMCRLDDGSLSPAPALDGEIWDYAGYLRWSERVSINGRQETLPCVRRRTFAQVRYPDSRARELQYHLDFAKRFRTATSSAVVRLYHTDAPDQWIRRDIAITMKQAKDHAINLKTVLDRHGDAMAQFAPGLLAYYTRGLATQQFLSGDRLGGIRTIGRLLRRRTGWLSGCAVLGLGILGPRVLARAQAERVRRFASLIPGFSM